MNTADIIDKFTITCPDVDDCILVVYKLLEKMAAKNLPEIVFSDALVEIETALVELFYLTGLMGCFQRSVLY